MRGHSGLAAHGGTDQGAKNSAGSVKTAPGLAAYSVAAWRTGCLAVVASCSPPSNASSHDEA